MLLFCTSTSLVYPLWWASVESSVVSAKLDEWACSECCCTVAWYFALPTTDTKGVPQGSWKTRACGGIYIDPTIYLLIPSKFLLSTLAILLSPSIYLYAATDFIFFAVCKLIRCHRRSMGPYRNVALILQRLSHEQRLDILKERDYVSHPCTATI